MGFDVDDFIAGYIGGICGLIVGYPLETVKVRQQTWGGHFFTAAGRTFRHQGFLGFFQGMSLPLCTIGPANALLFGIYGNILNSWEKGSRHKYISFQDTESMKHVYVAGVVGGFFQTMFVCPVETIKTNLQAKTEGKGSWKKHYEIPYNGSFQALVGILKDRGVKGLYRGLVPLLIRDVPSSGLYTLTYELLMYHNLSCWNTPVFIKQTIAGGTAGVVSWMFVLPMDVVKNRMQVDNPNKPQFKGMMDCFYKSYKGEGLRIFFKGAPATLLRTFPVNAATFIGYEAVLSHHF